MDTNHETPDSVYNTDFKWLEKSTEAGKRPVPKCTICTVPEEKNESVTTTEYKKKINDFRALFTRFPYLKDALCKFNADSTDQPVREKHQTTYDSDYKSKHCERTVVKRVVKDDADRSKSFKGEKRGKLKTRRAPRCDVKYSGISPPEPYVVPISEYRSTIHTTGTRIIKEQLLIPKIKK